MKLCNIEKKNVFLQLVYLKKKNPFISFNSTRLKLKVHKIIVKLLRFETKCKFGYHLYEYEKRKKNNKKRKIESYKECCNQ